ncbi:MAG: ABC transporter substrate-binding protein [Terriglobales bacterium]
MDRFPSGITNHEASLPARVVSLQPSATDILARLGLLDRVVAATRHCVTVCPAGAGRLLVEDSWTAQAGQIIAARPDLVIAAVPYQVEAIAEILKAGIRFVALAPRTLADIYGDIALLANIFDRHDTGQQVIACMRAAIASVRNRARSAPRPRVYCEEWGKPMLRSQRWVAELVEAAGGEFFGAPATQTSADEVAAADPDVMICAWCGAGDRVPLAKLVRERNWTELRAIRARRVFAIRDELLTTPSPILLDGLRALAAALHPDIFPVAPGLRRLE